jgi:phosphoglycolate phosphatase-like HAD superfamily hydrolase
MENKVLVFDMDGTIADLYGVDNWLEDLKAENPRPYEKAKPIYPADILNTLLEIFKANGWRIVVTTWLAKGSTKEYDNLVREAKLAWLDKYDFPYDEIHLVKFGTTKANCTRHLGGFQVLIDDNEAIRNGWHLGDTINANENVIEKLIDLLEQIL